MPGSDWVCSGRNFTDASHAMVERDVLFVQVGACPVPWALPQGLCPCAQVPTAAPGSRKAVPAVMRPFLSVKSQIQPLASPGQVSCGQASGGTNVSRAGQADTPAGSLHSPRTYPDLRLPGQDASQWSSSGDGQRSQRRALPTSPPLGPAGRSVQSGWGALCTSMRGGAGALLVCQPPSFASKVTSQGPCLCFDNGHLCVCTAGRLLHGQHRDAPCTG